MGNGKFMWTGKKTDITDDAIRAVFEHMYNSAEGTGFYEIIIPGFGKMQFYREKE